MKTKVFEVRDKATFIPVLAVQMAFPAAEPRRYLMRRCGYPADPPFSVLVTRLEGKGQATADPYDWRDRTMRVAHDYIREHFADLEDGAVVDVEVVLGETQTPKASERFTA